MTCLTRYELQSHCNNKCGYQNQNRLISQLTILDIPDSLIYQTTSPHIPKSHTCMGLNNKFNNEIYYSYYYIQILFLSIQGDQAWKILELKYLTPLFLRQHFLLFLSPAPNSPPSSPPLTTKNFSSVCLVKGPGRKTETNHISHYI